MWSYRDDNNRVSCSSSKSSSSSSHSSLISPNPMRTTMEEVWKDINLTYSLHNHCSNRDDEDLGPLPNTTTTTTNFLGMKLQDFLAQPFSKDPQQPPPPPPPPMAVPTSTTRRQLTSTTNNQAPPPPPGPPLCLNSGPEFPFFENMNNDDDHTLPSYPRMDINNHCNDFVSNSHFDPFGLSSSPFGNKKRVSDNDDSSGDRRFKRMIKNRESAARSRARKQAYANELELEVAHLSEENAKLRKQHQQLYLAAASANQLPKKANLKRSLTAPF